MKTLGIVLAVVGFFVCGGALMMDTTVFSPSVALTDGFGTGSSRTHNLGLLQTQELIFIGGCALFLAGCIVAAIGQLEETSIRGAVTEALRHDVAETQTAIVETPHVINEAGSAKWIVTAVGLGFAGLALTFAIAGGGADSSTSAIESNSEMLADNLEMLADNLEAAVR